MPSNFASILVLVSLVVTVVPPGYPAYIGAYAGLAASLIALLAYGWTERTAFAHPTVMAILAAIVLVAMTVPLTYQGVQDVLAPILVLPMLSAIAIGLLARPARWVPTPALFAVICLAASAIAFVGGTYASLLLKIERPGLGNNPIHFGSLAAMAGGLALVGVTWGRSPWRYLFLAGPILGMGTTVISGSRGPMAGAFVMACVGSIFLLVWFWRERPFRFAMLAALAAGIGVVSYLVGSGNDRVIRILNSAFDIFRLTGSYDDIRAALYISALQSLHDSPIFGVGLGQIMTAANTMFPDIVPRARLDNLHADWANFATMAGSVGLLAWLLLLASPLLLLLDSRARRDRPVVLGAVLLFVGQLTLGVSNATFGILPQTMIFAVPLGYFLIRARRLVFEHQMQETTRGTTKSAPH